MEGRSGAGTLEHARQALAQGQWDAAYALLAQATDGEVSSVAGLEAVAAAAYGSGHFEQAVSAWEDLHALHLGSGRRLDAAAAAATVAMYLLMDTGLMAPVRGWVARAETLLPTEDTPVHALVAMVRAYERLLCGDVDAADGWAQRAIAMGAAYDMGPAMALSRVAAARIRILAGEVDEGVAALDEVAVLLVSGELDALTTGMVWCELICAMQGLALFDRAEEWTDAMQRWRPGTAFGGINGRCRVHRAEMLRLRGACEEAEAEALRACEELRPWMRREFGWPLTELGTIRLRRGDLAGAEQAFVAAHESAWDPQPGLALVLLARGDTATATAMIDEALAHPVTMPSKERPPFGALRRAPLLDARVEIAVAAGDAATAGAAARELSEIAETFGSPALAAGAALARGRAALADGDVDRCVRQCEEAVARWTEVRAPYEAAVARTVLAEAHRLAGNDACAGLEEAAARSTFARIGARPRLPHTDETAPHRAIDVAELDAASVNVFVCDGDTRTVTYGGATVLLHDLKGLRYLAQLMAEPGRERHAVDLVAVERGSLPTRRPDGGGTDGDSNGTVGDGGDAGAVLDEHARTAYRRRLDDIEEDIEEATAFNDPERAALARVERDYLVRELARAVGLGGRPRRSGSNAERARSSVTRSLRYAMTRIAEHHPTLAAHLEHSVRTGVYCSYSPDPAHPVAWRV